MDNDRICGIRDAMKERAKEFFDAGLAAANPREAVLRALQKEPMRQSPTVLLSVGKAAVGMAQAALEHLSPQQTLIVTNVENARELAGATLHIAGHPVPDLAGLRAAEAVCAALDPLGADQCILVLISGGGSALLPAPVAGVSLADKAQVNRALLASGADITQINLVRQQLSRLKGGGLTRLSAPASVRALIVSDVVSDDMRVIASGPTAQPIGTCEEARAMLKGRGIWQQIPASVRAILDRAPQPPGEIISANNTLVGSNAISRNAMAQLDHHAHLFPQALEGDVQDAAQRIAQWAAKPGVWLWGGETTVRVRGTGRGGRNQELSLHLARQAQRRGWQAPWVALVAGTDGRDGPTDAAGGLVDDGTIGRMLAAECDVEGLLANNDSYRLLDASGDHFKIGGTGTNVADLGILIRA